MTFFGKRDGMTLECNPPAVMAIVGETVGTKDVGTCVNGDTSARMDRTVLGIDRMTVGA